MDGVDGSSDAHVDTRAIASGSLPASHQSSSSPRPPSTPADASQEGRRGYGLSAARAGQTGIASSSSPSLSPLGSGASPTGSLGHDMGAAPALGIPDPQSARRTRLYSPTPPITTPSPSLLSAGALHYNASQLPAGPSSAPATGLSRFPPPSSSNLSLYGASPSQNQSGANSVVGSAGESGSNHSRHSSGYTSSVGGGGTGFAGSGSAFIGYGALNPLGSASSQSTVGSGTASTGFEGGSFTSHLSNGKTNGVGSLASVLARSSLSDQAAAAQMVATESHGSSGAGSAHSLGGMESSNPLPRPPFLRQSFSDDSPFNMPGSPAASQFSSSSGSNLQVPVSLPTTGPLSASDPRTQLHISNLPYRVRWQDLKDLFRKAGTVLRADVSLTADNRSRGYGTVLLASEDDARRACDMFAGFNWQGRTLDVRIDRSGTLLGIGVGQGVPSPSNLSPAMPSLLAHPSPTPAPLAGLSAGTADGSRTSGGQQYSMGQAGQMPMGVSPALYPFLGASTRASFATPSSMQQPNWPGMTFAQQRSSSLSAGVPSQSQRSTPYNASHSAQQATTFPQLPLGMLPSGQPMQPQQQQQPQSFMPPFVGAGPTQHLRPNVMPPSMASPVPQMMNPFAGALGSLSSPMPPSLAQQPPANSYYGRVLFVGNLPFHCQWQDLKDLFRAAGNIQRADVALSAEGRSRGFGTVLFATAEDAQNAVRIYHGYEYSGRTLKVHFDRFAQVAAPPSGALPGTPSQYTGAFAAANTPTVAPSSNSQQQQQQQQQYMQQQQQQQAAISKELSQYQIRTDSHGASMADPYAGYSHQSFSALGTADAHGSSPAAQQQQHQIDARASSSKVPSAHPGRISLPPQGFPGYGGRADHGVGQFSPMQARMHVPMTPGMPGFTFHAVPQTPPIHPHFLSPGLNGPFSPPLGSPHYGGPATPGASSAAFNPHINHAPGAPIHFSNGMTTPISNTIAVPPGYNPMFPPVGVNFAMMPGPMSPYEAPSQQNAPHGLPQTPHWSQPPRPAKNRRGQEQEPPRSSRATKQEDRVGEVAPSAEFSAAPTKETEEVKIEPEAAVPDSQSGGEGYPFPLVQPQLSTVLQRRASTNSPAGSPLPSTNPPSLLPKSPGWERRGSLVLQMSSADESQSASHAIQASTGATSTEELARKIAKMSVQKALLQRGQEKSTSATVSPALSNRGGPASLGSALELPKTSTEPAVGTLSGSALDDSQSSDGSAM